MNVDKLRELIEEDEFGLLNVIEKPQALSEDERLADAFQDVLDFVDENGREPKEDLANMAEAKLAWRLRAIRSDRAQLELLAGMDDRGLLQVSDEPPSSLDELFGSDELGMLDIGDAVEIMDTSALPELKQPDERATNKRADDFERFEPLFVRVQDELRRGVRKLAVFRTSGEQPRAGEFFVLRGVLCLVDEVDDKTRDRHGRINGRMRVVFENGTEANYLLRAFTRKLYQAGKRVTDPVVAVDGGSPVENPDSTSTVYILKSLSDDPRVQSIPFLHKIGFTDGSVERRIAGAEDSITYLKAPVEVVGEYEVPGAGARSLEKMLHKVFAEVRLDAGFERNGVKVGDATEWFSVPRDRIDEAIELIQRGAIVNYRYDPKTLSFVLAE